MHIKSIVHNSIAMFYLKPSYPDGIRTRVHCPLRHAAGASIIFICYFYFYRNVRCARFTVNIL
jgi:hypothetical protein